MPARDEVGEAIASKLMDGSTQPMLVGHASQAIWRYDALLSLTGAVSPVALSRLTQLINTQPVHWDELRVILQAQRCLALR